MFEQKIVVLPRKAGSRSLKYVKYIKYLEDRVRLLCLARWVNLLQYYSYLEELEER